jgi:HEPN domain-containing protein
MPDYSPAVDALVIRLMKEQNLDINDEAAKEAFKAAALDKINHYIISRIPDERLSDFEELLQENNSEKISYFLEEILGSAASASEEAPSY